MKENLTNFLAVLREKIDLLYFNIKQFVNSYDYNYPLIFSITGGIIILLIVIIILKRRKKIKNFYKQENNSINFESESNSNVQNDTTLKYVAEDVNSENEINEPIEVIDEIVDETINEMESDKADLNDTEKSYNSELPLGSVNSEFIDTVKKDFEAEFINIVKRNLPASIEYNKNISLSDDIADRCNYIIERLEKIEDNYKFLEDYYLSKALFYFYSNNEEKAFNILTEGMEKFPESSKIYIEKSRILIHRNNIEDAKVLLKKAQELNSADFDSYLLLGEIYFKEGKFSDALNLYKKVILLDSQNSTGYAYKGYLLAKKGFISDGVKDLKKAISLDYKNSLAYYMLGDIYKETGNFSKAILSFNKAKKFNCSINDVDEKLAVSYYKIDKFSAVVSLLKNSDIKDTYLKEILADSYIKLNLYNDAVEIYIDLFNNVDKEKYIDNLISVYKKKNDIKNVIKYLEIKLDLHKENLDLMKEIADIYYFNIKDKQTAKKYYEQIIDKEKDFDSIYHLINIYFKERDYKKCIELYKNLENKEAIIPEIFYKVGLSFFKEQKYDSAIQLLSKAEITGWVDEELYIALGYSYLKTNHLNKSEESFKKALTINPYNFQVHNNLGTIYAKQEKFKDAVKEFKEALNLEPDNKDILYNLYRVYKILSKTESEKYLSKLEEVI